MTRVEVVMSSGRSRLGDADCVEGPGWEAGRRGRCWMSV